MPNIFYMAEVVDIGIEKEKRRRDFYGLAAGYFKEKDVKELFANLKDWEETHIIKFTEIRDSIKEPVSTESFPGEMKEYMQALVDEKLYSKITAGSFAKEITSVITAIDRSMQFEKDAIVFFSELARFVPDASKNIIEQLVDEERRHFIYLNALKKTYKKVDYI